MSEVTLGRIGVIEFTPVIYTGTSGGGDDEYHGSNDPDTPAHHIIDAPIPPGAQIIEAWYTPFHAVFNLVGFSWIDVDRHNSTQIRLAVAGVAGSNTRMRIKVHVLYVG
jgi:hypothetical protein